MSIVSVVYLSRSYTIMVYTGCRKVWIRLPPKIRYPGHFIWHPVLNRIPEYRKRVRSLVSFCNGISRMT